MPQNRAENADNCIIFKAEQATFFHHGGPIENAVESDHKAHNQKIGSKKRRRCETKAKCKGECLLLPILTKEKNMQNQKTRKTKKQ